MVRGTIAMKNTLRFLFISAAILVFAGLLLFSLLKVTYTVQGEKKKELYVIERSLTHEIKRAPDGKLVATGGPVQQEPVKGQAKPCPT
jgi:hypothetical protein